MASTTTSTTTATILQILPALNIRVVFRDKLSQAIRRWPVACWAFVKDPDIEHPYLTAMVAFDTPNPVLIDDMDSVLEFRAYEQIGV